MSTTNNITNTGTINIYNNTEQIFNPNPELLDNSSSTVHIPIKVCNKCNTSKYITEFYKRKASHDGYKNQCKNCENNCKKEYNKKNKDIISEHRKEYYEKNKIKANETTKQYYKVNKDKILQYNL